MTLQQIIAAYEATRPQPIAEHDVVTPLGHAVTIALRLVRALEPLADADRTAVLDLFAHETLKVMDPSA